MSQESNLQECSVLFLPIVPKYSVCYYFHQTSRDFQDHDGFKSPQKLMTKIKRGTVPIGVEKSEDTTGQIEEKQTLHTK